MGVRWQKRRGVCLDLLLLLLLGLKSRESFAWAQQAPQQTQPGKCAMRGSCVQNSVCNCALGSDGCEAGGDMCPFPGVGAPCELPADDTAAPQNASVVAPSIEHVCPGVMTLADMVCCNDVQLAALKQQLDMAHGFLASCPACWANFQRFWCVFTCSPQQASFLHVTKSRVCNASLFPSPNSGTDGEPPQETAGCQGTPSDAYTLDTVQAVRLLVDEAYATALFTSCKDVTVSATGQKAVDMAFGGAVSAADFLRFQGVVAYSSGQNPINIQVVLINASNAQHSAAHSKGGSGAVSLEEVRVMREETVACHVDDVELACFCSDCSSACPPPPPPLTRWKWYRVRLDPLMRVEVNVFVAAAALLLILALAQGLMEAVDETERGFPALSCLAYHFRAPPAQGVERVGGMTDGAEGGGQVEHGIEDGGWLGRVLGGVAQECARRPRRVIMLWSAVTALAAVSLMVMPMRVLKDPVSLWSAPGSRTATDRAMFDAAFGPFWRTQMFIIRPQQPQEGPRRYERGRGWSKDGSSGYGEGGRWLGGRSRGRGRGEPPRGIASPYTLKSVLDLQVQMESLRVWCGELVGEDDDGATQEAAACEEGDSWGVEDLCYQPTPGAGCIVQSALEFWQMNWTRVVGSDGACASLLPAPYYTPANASVCEMALRERMNRCAIYGPSEVECWSRAGIPLVQPNILFGWPVDEQEGVDEQEPHAASTSTSTSKHTPRQHTPRQRVIYQDKESRAAPPLEAHTPPHAHSPPHAHTPADAEALIVTYLFNNDAWSATRAAVWEAKVMALLGAPLLRAPVGGAALLRAPSPSTNPHNSDAHTDREAGGAGATRWSASSKYAWQDELNVSFSVERATRDEVARSGEADMGTVLLSYIVMLCYVWLSIGRGSGGVWRGIGGGLWRGFCSIRRISSIRPISTHIPTQPPATFYDGREGEGEGVEGGSREGGREGGVRQKVEEEGFGERGMLERGMLAATALAMVLMSILLAAAACSFAGVPATMILSEVIPFLVLAIGVDNVFLITYAFDEAVGLVALPRSRPQSESVGSTRTPQSESSPQSHSIASTRSTPLQSDMDMEAGLVLEGVERACCAGMRVGPSIVCAAAAECAAFLIGATTGMPAVISFSRFAGAAVCVDVVVQLTLYPALLSLTFGARHASNRRQPTKLAEHESMEHSAQTGGERERRGASRARAGGGGRNVVSDLHEHLLGADVGEEGVGEAADVGEEGVGEAADDVRSLDVRGLDVRGLAARGLASPLASPDAAVDVRPDASAPVTLGPVLAPLHSYEAPARNRQIEAAATLEGARGGDVSGAEEGWGGTEWEADEGWGGIEWEARVMSKDGRVWVLILALCLVLSSLLASSAVEVGLDQTDALPQDSFLIPYFKDLGALVGVGPPVFFIVSGKGFNLSSPEVLEKVCTRRGCRRDSLGNAVSNAARFSQYTRIASGVSNVADDLIGWLLDSRQDPSSACCRRLISLDGSLGPICPAHWNPKAHGGQTAPAECACNRSLTRNSPACPTAPQVPCDVPAGCLTPNLPDAYFLKYNGTSGVGKCWGVRLKAMCPLGGEAPYCARECYAKYGHYAAPCVSAEAVFPSGDEVHALLGAFLNSDCPTDPADAHCPLCGQHYRSDLSNLSSPLVYTEAEAGGGGGGVRAARFMSYHAPLRTQTDFIEALEYAYKLAEDMSTVLGLTVTPYSVFYVFFEQYVGIEEAAMRVSALGLTAVFVIVGVLLRCRSSALLVLLSVVGVEVSVVGAMGVLGIKLNALSTVNLVAGIGIAVEFSVHVVHAFASAHGSREERALHAMRGVGGAVVSGIAVTKLLGVCVLAMATSRIFVVYYFRMYLALVIAGCFYGLVVLPVMLSIFGPLNTSPGTPSSPPIKSAELTKAEPEKDETSR